MFVPLEVAEETYGIRVKTRTGAKAQRIAFDETALIFQMVASNWGERDARVLRNCYSPTDSFTKHLQWVASRLGTGERSDENPDLPLGADRTAIAT